MRQVRRVARLVCAFAALGALLRSVASCTSESIVIAAYSADDAGKPPPAPIRCTGNGDCQTGVTFCSKTACTDTTGTCEALPVFCPTTAENPECGCNDGITYFNDCLRQAAGEASFTAGPCAPDVAQPCGDGLGPCPDAGLPLACAQLTDFQGACQHGFQGTCWVLPSTCPTPPPGADRWNSCTTEDTCLDTCTAIATGGAYRRAPQCSPPPGGP